MSGHGTGKNAWKLTGRGRERRSGRKMRGRGGMARDTYSLLAWTKCSLQPGQSGMCHVEIPLPGASGIRPDPFHASFFPSSTVYTSTLHPPHLTSPFSPAFGPSPSLRLFVSSQSYRYHSAVITRHDCRSSFLFLPADSFSAYTSLSARLWSPLAPGPAPISVCFGRARATGPHWCTARHAPLAPAACRARHPLLLRRY